MVWRATAATADAVERRQAAPQSRRRAAPGAGRIVAHLLPAEEVCWPWSAPTARSTRTWCARASAFISRPPLRRRSWRRKSGRQFEAFRATGLPLDHVNGHKHIHLHPTVARLVVEIGRDFGMRAAARLPFEAGAPLRRAAPDAESRARRAWSPVSGARCAGGSTSAGIVRNDQVFGIAWTGRMVEDRLLARCCRISPTALSEIYARTPLPARLAPRPGLPPRRGAFGAGEP